MKIIKSVTVLLAVVMLSNAGFSQMNGKEWNVIMELAGEKK